MPTVGGSPTQRHNLIDALRGIALLGILLVNIQSFSWRVGAPTMGLLYAESPTRDVATVYFTTLLLEYKVYPLFCFCFGYGFAIMAKRGRASGVNAEALRRRITRRLNFMLLLGLVHGFLIWWGDILARYALAGYMMRRYARLSPRRLLRPMRHWATVTLGFTAILCLVSWLSGNLPTDSEAMATMLSHAHAYSTGSYRDTVPARVADYLAILALWVLLIPQAILLFLLGAFVSRMGWLRDPAQHRAKWLGVFLWSFGLGVLPSLVAAKHAVAWSVNPQLVASGTESVALNVLPLMAPAYVAAFALLASLTVGKWVVRLLTPIGRMALTNYLLQSVAMSILLTGYGFGLANAGQFALAVMAMGIFLGQAAFSRCYMRHHTHGPVESLWRRYTYQQTP